MGGGPARRAVLIGVAAAALLAGAAATARAASILVAVGSSDDDIATDALVRSAAEAKVLALRHNVLAADVATRRGVALERVPACLDRDTACMKALVEPAGTDRVLLFMVDRRSGLKGESQWLVVGYLIDGATGELVVSDQRLCDACTPERLPPHVEDITAILLANDPARVELAPAPPDPDAGEAPRPYRTWKWLAIGAGLVAAGGGIALIAIDEPAVGGGAQQPTVRETKVPGFVAVGAGAALLATGVVLWIKDGRTAAPRAPAPAALVPVDGGAVLVLGGRF